MPYVLRRCFSFFMLPLLTTKQPVERAFKIVQYTKVSKKLYEIRNEKLTVWQTVYHGAYHSVNSYKVLAYNEGKIPYILRPCFSFFMLAPFTTKLSVERAFKIVQCAKVLNNLM